MAVSASSRSREAGRPALPIAARRHSLIAEVERAMRSRCGFSMDSPLVIGVSGGADSLALLIACVVMRDRRETPARFEPIAAHVNHHLRESAEVDAQHVRSVCDLLGVSCEVIDIAPGELEGNVLANARQLRYEALADFARSRGASHVAVAHHAEDQLETILAALCRGTGIEGAAGMRWSRPLDDRAHLIRPLLGAMKADCISLCEAAGIKWREDPTNADAAFARARLRRDVLPVLEELWPGAAQRAAATGELISVAGDALKARLSVAFGPSSQTSWNRSDLAAHPAPLLAAGLRRAALAAHPGGAEDVLHRHLIAAADAVRDGVRKPRAFSIGADLHVRITAREVVLHHGGPRSATESF